MGYPEVKTNNEYLDRFIEIGVKNYFDISLAPAQSEVLRTMLMNDYVLFIHGHGVGATFLLSILSVILRLINPDINIVVASTTIVQAKFINKEVEGKFSKYNLKPLNVVSIKEALSGEYDVLLLDEITHLSNEYIESLVEHIKGRTISKIVAVCGGYRSYFPIAKLNTAMYSGSMNPNNNKAVVFKCYEDMPPDFFDLDNIEEIKKTFDYPEEFNMEYKGYVI